MQTPGSSASLLTPIGYDRSRCGYCGKSESFSYYATTKYLTPDFYQSLILRGWRRSGSIIYKPDLKASCCQQYTIRLDSEQYCATKDQRQCVNRFNKHILGDSYVKEAAKLYSLSREQAKRRDTEFDLLARIHEGEKSLLKTPPEPAHDFAVTLEPDTFTEEKYDLFVQYQKNVHHEPASKISKRSFTNFLCNSPLPRSEVNGRHLGSFHQCYRVDGELIAMSVIDLLPYCVSGVYFIYHETVHKFSFGKLSAMREIALAKEAGYKYWYAGFYIHSCPKMHYKGDFSPQTMLDPESYTWDPLDKTMKNKLEKQKYVSLSRERLAAASGLSSAGDFNSPEPTDAEMGEEVSIDGEEVADPRIPLFARSMPGIMTREEILAEVDLDQIKLSLHGTSAICADLVNWDTGDMDLNDEIKGIIAELVSAVGSEIAREMTVTFS